MTEGQEEIYALKERIIRLEAQVDMLNQYNHKAKETPFWKNFMVGFAIVSISITLLPILLLFIIRIFQ
ncbi:MAG: hypothetical protein ACE3L7_17550 [Candidatus Pristimantibacillus sp.]